MISILTLTYKRKELLEEAVQSYLLQIEGHEDTTEMGTIELVPNFKNDYWSPILNDLKEDTTP